MTTKSIRVVLEALTQQYQAKMREATASTRAFGDKLTATGSAFTAISVAAGATAIVLKRSFDEWDRGVDALRVGTGATGQALAELEGSMERVAGNVTQGVGDVGQAMADLARRTGQTGQPLEDLTKRFLDLERITGEAATSTIPAVTRLFGDWSIATEDQAAAMDELFRASQNTGIGVGRLSELMVQFGSPLRQLGLDFDFTAAMFAKFEAEGVNIQTALPGLRMALKHFAAAGREPAEALAETIDQIKNASSAAEANTIAFEVFGTRAGPDMAAAIREGRFELDDLIGAITEGGDSIEAAAEDTLDLSDKLAMLRNRLVTVLGPFGELGAIAAGAVASIGPLLFGVGALSSSLGRLASGSTAAAAGLVAVKSAGAAALPILGPAGLAAAAIGVGAAFDAASKGVEDYAHELGAAHISSNILGETTLETASGFEFLTTKGAAAEGMLRGWVATGDRYTAMAEAMAGATDDLAGSADGAALSIQELRAQNLALVDPVFAVIAAVRHDTEAEAALTEARATLDRLTAQGKEGTKAYAAAQRLVEAASLDATQAHAGLLGAVDSLTQAVEDGEVSQRDAKAALEEMAGAAGLTKEETKLLVSQLRAGVRELERWNSTPLEDKSATVTFNITQTGKGPEMHEGGVVRHDGGPVGGAGPRRLRGDEVPIVAQRGEFVINRRSAAKLGPRALYMLNRMHAGGDVLRRGPTRPAIVDAPAPLAPTPAVLATATNGGIATPVAGPTYNVTINAGAFVHEREVGRYVAEKLQEFGRRGGRHH